MNSDNQGLAQAQRATKNDLRSFIAGDSFKQQVALALPKHMTPDRFARVALTALTRTPKLLECTRESLLRCLMDCSQLGLEPDGRHAHLIPYKDVCTLIIDYKGLMALARRSGDVAVFRAELVKEADAFDWHNGTVTHSINWRKDRGPTQCVYSYVKFKDGAEDWEVMTLAEVDAIRKRSRAGSSGPWVTDFDEMAKKTVIRRHSKRLTLSPEFADAVDKDDDREERPAKGREVQPAEVPLLFSGVAADAVAEVRSGSKAEEAAAPRELSAREEFWERCAREHYDTAKVCRILTRNKLAEIESPERLTEEDAAAALLVWDTLVELYGKEAA